MEHLLWVFLLTSLMTSAFVDTKVVNVTKTVGEDCVLSCEGPEGRVDALQWRQTESGKVLLTYRDDKPEQGEQFKGRVQLQASDLRNGNLDVILQNVSLEDSGNYTCEGPANNARRKRNTDDVFAHVQLFVSESQKDKSVNDPPLTDRNTAVAVVVPVFIIFVLLGAGIVFWKRKEIKQWQALKRSPEEC